MTREEAAGVLKHLWDRFSEYDKYMWPEEKVEALTAIAVLRRPEPDPDTGLMPCGCGGALKFERFNDGFFDLERIACECGIEITSGPGFCKPAWNRAMGWREKE